MPINVTWKQGLTLPHDPDDTADYEVDFTAVVGLSDTLASANTDDEGVTSTIISTTPEGLITIRVNGGTTDTAAFVTVQAVMASGRTQSRTINFTVLER